MINSCNFLHIDLFLWLACVALQYDRLTDVDVQLILFIIVAYRPKRNGF